MTAVRSRRSPVACVVATLGVLVLLFATLGSARTPAGAQDGGPGAVSSADSGGLLTLAGCIQGTHHIAITFVFDESRSLKETDPDGLRVAAALNALDGLEELTAGTGGVPTQVDLEVAAFSDTYRVALPWTTLDAETAPLIRTSMKSFGKKVDGIETDIVNALVGARAALSSHAADVEATAERAPCKAIVLFTDGDYVVNPRTTSTAATAGRTKAYAPGIDLMTKEGAAAATAAGREAMCRPDGIADGIRSDDIVLLSVMLRPDGSKEGDGFLRAITTGKGPDGACGRISAAGSGELLHASDPDALIVGFDGITALAAGGTPIPAPTDAVVCADKACDKGSQTFDVDSLTRRFRVLALAPAAGLGLRISGPAGSTTVTRAGKVDFGGVTGNATEVAGRGLAVVIDRPSGAGKWSGEWTVSLEGSGALVGKPATLQVYLFSDITVRMKQGSLVRGAPAPVTAEIVLPPGQAAGALIRSVDAKALVEDPISGRRTSVALTGPVKGPFTADFTAPSATTANAFTVSAEFTVVTVDGARTTTRSPRISVLVRRPAGDVQFAPGVLTMPAIQGKGSTSADLVVVGGRAASCVWVESAGFKGADGLTVTIDGHERIGRASCLKVAKGASLIVPVELHNAERADATVSGVLRLRAETAGMKPTVTDLQVSTSMVRGVDKAKRMVLAIVLMAAGLAVPLALLLVLNIMTARFQTLDVVRGAAIPIHVVNGAAERIGGTSRRFRFHDSDFESLAGAGDDRRFVFGGVEFRARASKSPFGTTWAQAAPEGGAEKLKGGVGRRVGLDAALAGSWVFLLDPDATRLGRPGVATGTLLAFITEGPSANQFTRMLADVDDRIGKVADDLASAVRRQPPSRTEEGSAEDPETGVASGTKAPDADAQPTDD